MGKFLFRKIIVLFCMIFILLPAIGFAKGQREQQSGSVINVTFAHIFEPGHSIFEASKELARRLETESKGRIKVNLVPAGALGGMDSNLEALSLGSIQITVAGESYTSRYYEPMGISAAPYAFQSWDHFKNFIKSDLFSGFKEEFAKKTGNYIIGTFTSGFRNVTANKPIRNPTDMVGLKIRVPDAPSFTAMPKAVGASPTPINFSEVYLALQQKVVDAEENPLETIYNMKFYEVQSHICITAHMMEPAHFVISKSFWDSLTEDERKLVSKIGSEVGIKLIETAYQKSEELLEEFEKLGNTVVRDVNIPAFAAATYPFNTSSERPWTKAQFDMLQSLK
jgi:tripartite ATP-independent transporter DctP family solute receptor